MLSFLLLAMMAAPPDVDVYESGMKAAIEMYASDKASLERTLDIADSGMRAARMERFYQSWVARLGQVRFEQLDKDGKVDFVLLRNHVRHELDELKRESEERAATAEWAPFAARIAGLEEARRRMEELDGRRAAAELSAIALLVKDASKTVEARLKEPKERVNAQRAARRVQGALRNMERWFRFYNGYDPVGTWWVAEPYKQVEAELRAYLKTLESGTAAVADGSDIVGNPLGRAALVKELEFEMIPYTPEELVAVGEREMAWCEAEMRKASREMGFGDDWHKALEKVKTLHVEPGRQPQMIRELALEAEAFLDKHQMVTIPEVARETWRMEMMTPQRQLVNPFFTGGEVISVSYPTSGMTHEQKLMSLRGNNRHFSHATVFHELIPGHHLQIYMGDRFRAYRSALGWTPFVTEGWALYWEMLLWDRGFQKSPEDKVGALFWRMHRCARIVFSLKFHLGQMTPRECIDYLVERVGHERDNAVGEVRRSFNGSYGPLYQAAYLLGGLQMYAMRRELVEGGAMTEREFHDEVLRQNRLPLELMRASLTGAAGLTRDYKTAWRSLEPYTARK